MIKEVNIKGLRGQYFVCSTGKLYKWEKDRMKEISGWLEHSRNGYKKRYNRVSLPINGESKKFYKHRLILTVFDREPEFGEVARHLNDKELDNRWPENLAWGTHKENAEDREKNKEIKQEKEYEWEKDEGEVPF